MAERGLTGKGRTRVLQVLDARARGARPAFNDGATEPVTKGGRFLLARSRHSYVCHAQTAHAARNCIEKLNLALSATGFVWFVCADGFWDWMGEEANFTSFDAWCRILDRRLCHTSIEIRSSLSTGY